MFRTVILAAGSFFCGIVFATYLGVGVTAQNRRLELKELARVDLGTWCLGKEVVVELAANGPGESARHYHPGHVFTWVIEGSQEIEFDGKPPLRLAAGDLGHEAPSQISRSRNTGPSRVVIFRILEKGQPAQTAVQ
jgi:cupin domain